MKSNLQHQQPYSGDLLEHPILDGIRQFQDDYCDQQDPMFMRYPTYFYDNQAALNHKIQSEDFQESDENISTRDNKNILPSRQEAQQSIKSEYGGSEAECEQEKEEEKVVNIIDSNIEVVSKKRNRPKQMSSKNRLLAIFFPKLKQFLRSYLIQNNPSIKQSYKNFDQELYNLPGMKKSKNIDELKQLLKVKVVCGVQVDMLALATFYLQSNTSLLDAIFPLNNIDGNLRTKGLEKKSARQIVSFLPIYEMMIKLQGQDEEVDHDISFQNIWYYAEVTDEAYQPFDMNR